MQTRQYSTNDVEVIADHQRPVLGPIYQSKVGAVVTNTAMALDLLKNDTSISVDLETSGLNFKKDKIAVVNLEGNQSGILAVLHVRGRLPEELKSFLTNRELVQLYHNGVGFDIPFLHENGVDPDWKNRYYDTMIGEGCVLTSGRPNIKRSLKAVQKRRTGRATKVDKQDHGGWMNPYLTEEQVEYCAADVKQLKDIRLAQLDKADPEMRRAMQIEMRLVPIVSRMKCNGVPIDILKLYNFLVGQNEMRKRIYPKLCNFFGRPGMNLGSHVQLKSALHDAGIIVKDTQADTLEEIVKLYPGTRDARICSAILEFKYAKKRIETYTPDWVKQFVVNGRIHPDFRQLGTDTGRFSCKNPNMQQWPQNMREIIGGLEGYLIVSRDYSQIEVRVTAAIARDEKMIDLIKTGLHIHTSLASQVFGVEYDAVTQTLKMLAKGITFLLLFGGGKNRFWEYASKGGSGLTRQECDAIFDRFFFLFPGIYALRIKAQNEGRKGTPVTLKMASGLKRTLLPQKDYRGNISVPSTQILNTLVQGNAAAGIKFALLECDKSGLVKYLSLQVHDELVSTVPDPEARDYDQELELCMTRGMQRIMDVPAHTAGTIDPYWKKD